MNALYQQVSQQILRQIQSGELKVGDRLPPEAKMANVLGVSRSTIRLAFTELENVGVLSRRKRTGTQIISSTPQKKFSMATQGVHEILSLGRDTRLDIKGIRNAKAQDIPELDGHVSETGYWLEVYGTRTLNNDNVPFSVNRIYVPARYSGIEPLLSDDVTSVFQLIENTFDLAVSRVKQSTRAVACDNDDAKIMGLRSGSAVLRIDAELYANDGKLLEISVAKFDSERFQLQTDMATE